jgi:hypothetical protein
MAGSTPAESAPEALDSVQWSSDGGGEVFKRFVGAVVLICATGVLAGGVNTAHADEPPSCPPQLQKPWGCGGGPPDPWEWE